MSSISHDTAQTVLFDIPNRLFETTRIDFAVAKISSNPVDVDNPISKNGNFRSSVLTDETKGLDGKKSGKR